MADPASERRAGGGARSYSGHLGPPLPAPPRRPQPCAPSPAGTTRTPTSAHPGLLLNLLAVSSQQPSPHALEAGPPGDPSALALSPRPPRPPLGRGASGRLPHAARPAAGHTPGPRLGPPPAPMLRGDSEPGSPAAASPLALPPARPPAAAAAAAAAAPLPPPLPSFPSPPPSGAAVGKPAPAAGDHRELKQETPSPGENPGGVERGEGSCWNLSGSKRPLEPREVPLAPSQGVPTSPPRSPSPGRAGALGSSTPSPPSYNTDHPRAAKGIKRLPSFPVVVCLLSIFRNEEKPHPALARPMRDFKQMKLLRIHPGEGLLSARKLALLEMATCQNRGESQDESRSHLGGWEETPLCTEVGSIVACSNSTGSSGPFYFCELSNTQHNLGQRFRKIQIISFTSLWNCQQAPHF